MATCNRAGQPTRAEAHGDITRAIADLRFEISVRAAGQFVFANALADIARLRWVLGEPHPPGTGEVGAVLS